MPGHIDPKGDIKPALKLMLRTSSGVAASACPDAETLAAWHERTLPAAEMAAFEHHAAECARCRAMLAAFVRADLDGLGAEAGEGVVGSSPFWRRWRLNWLVPVAATATALALYVAAPGPSDDRSAAGTPEILDGLRLNELPAPPEKPRDDSTEPSATGEYRAVEPPAPGSATVENRADTVDRRNQGYADASNDQKAAAPLIQMPPAPAATAPPPAGAFSPFAPVPAEPRSAEPPPVVAPLPPRAERDTAEEALPPLAARVPPSEVPPRPGPSAAAPGLVDAPVLERAPGAPRRERVGEPNEQAIGAVRDRAARVVPLSGGSSSLRFRVDAGRLDRSTSGDAWSLVPLPAGVSAGDITSGTVSGRTIWMVGRGGLVLHAPEGGPFTRVPGPSSADLRLVTAEDARTATVLTSDGREYSTADGGTRWTAR